MQPRAQTPVVWVLASEAVEVVLPVLRFREAAQRPVSGVPRGLARLWRVLLTGSGGSVSSPQADPRHPRNYPLEGRPLCRPLARGQDHTPGVSVPR